MKPDLQGDGRMGIRWARVLLAVVAVHVAGIVVPVLFIPLYAILTTGGPVDGFAGTLSTWILPILTLPAAYGAARGAYQAALNGLLVGLLVAGILGLLFFPPTTLQSLALFASIIAAGLVGGLLGGSKVPIRG